MTNGQGGVRKNRRKLLHLLIMLTTVTSSPVFAQPFFIFSNDCFRTWHPVVAIGGGLTVLPDVGESKTFPIVDPVTDQYYIYRADDHTHHIGFFDVFAGAEWRYYPEWSIQLGVGYSQTNDFETEGTLIQGADSLSEDQFHYHYDIFVRQLLAEAKLLYNGSPCYPYHPYVFAGLGAAFNRSEDFHTTVPPFLTFTRDYRNHTETAFSYALGLGVDVDIAPHARLGAGYRFNDYGRAELGKATIDGIPVSGTLTESDLYGHEIFAQLTLIA